MRPQRGKNIYRTNSSLQANQVPAILPKSKNHDFSTTKNRLATKFWYKRWAGIRRSSLATPRSPGRCRPPPKRSYPPLDRPCTLRSREEAGAALAQPPLEVTPLIATSPASFLCFGFFFWRQISVGYFPEVFENTTGGAHQLCVGITGT